MQNTPSPRPVPTRGRSAARLVFFGLASTVLVTLVPVVDLFTIDSLTGHVRDAYPDWPADLVRADRNAIVVYLAIVGVLGVLCWLASLWVVVKQKRSARWVTMGLFITGGGVALMNLTYGSEPYEQIIPPAYGLIGLLPALIGLRVVMAVWRQGQAPEAPASTAVRPTFPAIREHANARRDEK